MNIGEANDVNTLLRYMLGQQRSSFGDPVTDDQALAAAERLADRAGKTLQAGITGSDVRLGQPYFRTWAGA